MLGVEHPARCPEAGLVVERRGQAIDPELARGVEAAEKGIREVDESAGARAVTRLGGGSLLVEPSIQMPTGGLLGERDRVLAQAGPGAAGRGERFGEVVQGLVVDARQKPFAVCQEVAPDTCLLGGQEMGENHRGRGPDRQLHCVDSRVVSGCPRSGGGAR